MAVEIIPADPISLTPQVYELQETSLIPTFDINTALGSNSYIELFIYDLNQNIIYSDNNFTQYSVLNDGQSAGNNNQLSQIEIDIEQVLTTLDFTEGSYITYFNFLNRKIGSDIQPLYISEISSDRTEIRLDSTVLSDIDKVISTNNFISEREESDFFFDFYINLGDNKLYIANNILLDTQDPTDPTILVKLYEPLPNDVTINSTLWIVSSLEEPIAYQASFTEEPVVFNDTIQIQGPNFNIELKDQVNNSTLEFSYSDLLNTSLTSSQNQLNSLLEEKEIDINIDYTNFEDFIHFSSAQTRLENFYYKVSLIEQYSSSIALITSNITGSTSSSVAVTNSTEVYASKINEIITNFDGWDYYLYYSSGSWAWPKTTTEPPYLLAPTGSAAVISWYNNIILSASLFDNSNKDNLLFSIPEYLRDNPDNAPYELFIDMVAQHFDNIWIYYKDVTQKYNNDNRLEYGISKDVVADAIRDFGVKLYQNNFSNNDLYTAFLGLTPDGALFPFPNITGSLPTPSGFEYVDTLISASNDYLPLDDVNKSLYKRIYHNLPYLLKAKGTIPGLRALITSYGIPDTILRINEYGGKDKVDSNDWDYWQNEFNYAFKTDGDNFISSSWGINSAWGSARPSTVLFRFKTNGLPETNIPYSQSLWNKGDRVHVTLTYTGSAYASGSYLGSIKDPYYQYATLTLYPAYNTNPTVSASIYLPFFDGGWWSVMAKRTGSIYEIHSGNKIYEGGENDTVIGFYASSSVSVVSNDWRNTAGLSYFASSSIINGATYNPFSGSLQEIRYYQHPNVNSLLGEAEFKDYIMNPSSIEGNTINSSPDELVFRASLGGELYTGSSSIHPKVTGSWIPTSSFASDSDFYFDQTPIFVPNVEYFFYDQPIAGIRNTVSDKIRIEGNTLPTGSTLSPFRRLEQVIEASSSYTPNVNYLEVALSPQNEINEDIMGQLGFFNMGDYIGDPSERFSGNSYPDLDNLRNAYFEKYTKNYNLVDFIRLIKFFDNSLFKMIRDFVPARTSLASGIVIKQHLLERNKYPQPQVSWERDEYTGSIEIGEFSGGTGGVFEVFNGVNTSPYGADGNGPDNIFGITQSWVETTPSLLGAVSTTHDSQEEFYDGEFSGSNVIVTTQVLNEAYPLELASFEYTPILYRNGLYGVGNISTFTEGQFLNPLTTPSPGEILIMAPRLKKITLEKQKAFIKIHKIDCNGNNNTTPLGQITNLLIKYTTGTSYVEYDVLNISENSNYYLYEISNQNITNTGTGIDTEIKDYFVSSSKTLVTQSITSTSTIISSWDSSSGNIPHYGIPYFNTSSGIYSLGDTPNIPLDLTSSIYVFSNSAGPLSGKFDITINSIVYQSFPITITAGYSTHIISSSITPLKTDQLSFQVSRTGGAFTVYIESASLCITQSIAPTASVCDPIILEPYITTPNFYNSDENALLNNNVDNRISNFWQDVDYSTGVMTPTNFDLLISGSATRAAVQDSNYTTLRHINPRYNGSRTTSQKLNEWSNGDKGTYGKLPAVESLKTYIAYSDNIGGYPPEKMNTSGILVKYFISEDGDLIAPNTEVNALFINQGTFLTGENITIESVGNSSNTQPDFKTVFRGGSKIEPILTNQISHYQATSMSFASEISFTDGNPIATTTVGDYMATLSPTANTNPTPLSWTSMNFQDILSEGVDITNELTSNTSKYTIPGTGLSPEISNLVFNVDVKLQNTAPFPFDSTGYVRLVRNRSSVVTSLYQGYANGTGAIPPNSTANVIFSIAIPRNEIQANDQFYLEVLVAHPFVRYTTSSTFKISQIPLPTPSISCSGLWNYSSLIPSRIFASSSLLLQYYDNPQTHQQDIDNSGFFPITLPFTIQPGDEFRFEGDETKTFIVKSATIISGSFPRPRLNVDFDRPISGSGINLNQFLLRRYVDAAGSIIFNGYKTSGLEGPYLIKPEYVSDKMEQNIGKYIQDLTQKGLL